ncbi:uncharacterized protein HMPREF1541_10506 [Cyphellophora europaea CBS 101466]|uniref:ATP synthase F(0) complex subunit e, mitochondrial n=1 Tax=Cyphellophora europaea (strain CBS 101466) TaxID=1220924 RepID=W2S6K2_CYPE1|nr:uncharacterized protein HMPREF1541_10506 [Cyphellophora europaea CBS 101466]ETN44326.1 hypothetical protein HMPREF1541_10506 [Cyphellophora europaea CBS 101466]
MSTSQGVNVLRYSALLVGIFYGFSHQRTLNANTRAAHAQQEYHHKEDLIKQAKKAWAEKQLPPDQRAKGDGVITDPDDKNFDLEAYLKKVEAES